MALTNEEEKILKSIVIASENNPEKPEFPVDDPKFPATPTYKIKVPGFNNVWLKDESHNPTGTHKDRMAWEMVVTYRDFLLSKKGGQISKLPDVSIISSGSAAIAIQVQLKKYKLPNLRVLVDNHIDDEILKFLYKTGCKIFKTDLSEKAFSWNEILRLTKNKNGFDITSSEALDPTTRYYDWLSYEIINSSPDYCFVPFGSGHLFENILNINKREVVTSHHDPRFRGRVNKLRACNFFGSTTNNPKTKANKLFSPHLPFVNYDEQWIKLYRYAGYCGSKSDVYNVKEQFIDEALRVAACQQIDCEASGIAGLALMLQLKNKLPKDKKMLIVNTGKIKYPL